MGGGGGKGHSQMHNYVLRSNDDNSSVSLDLHDIHASRLLHVSSQHKCPPVLHYAHDTHA